MNGSSRKYVQFSVIKNLSCDICIEMAGIYIFGNITHTVQHGMFY